VIETEVVIVGAGPAGISAAMQLKRYAVQFVLLERERVGGLLWNANLVENYPGFPNGISGPALVARMEKQMKRLGVRVTRDEVLDLDLVDDHLSLRGRRQNYRPRRVILASGTQARAFPLTVEKSVQRRVFSDVVPLLEVRRKSVVIIGAGDAAFDHALNLAKRRNSVTILNHGQHVESLGLLRTRAAAEPLITYRPGITVRGVGRAGRSGGIRLRCESGGALEEIEADYLVCATGRDPKLDFLSAEVVAREGELVSRKMLYFAGDARNGMLRQLAIAAGDGLRAAMQVYIDMQESPS
jgi:thioredoxin reductase